MQRNRGLSLISLLLALAGCATAPPPGGLSFGLMGDLPYSQAQANLFDGLIDEMNREELAFVAHVGDITSGQGPCDDAWLEARKAQFARIRHPFVLLPGDNEWTDCWRSGFDPLERLAKWRSLFCHLGAPLGAERQPGRCEHVRWSAGGALFAGLNVPGSNNNLGRNAQMDAEHAARMRDVFAWLEEAERRARPQEALVILMQGNPLFERGARRDGYSALRARLREIAGRRGKPVLLVHGDTHRFRDDEPAPRLRRIEVWGAPHVRWLRARILPDGFHVEQAP